eukprot:7248169-Pyramimonas_sp.AAC.1
MSNPRGFSNKANKSFFPYVSMGSKRREEQEGLLGSTSSIPSGFSRLRTRESVDEERSREQQSRWTYTAILFSPLRLIVQWLFPDAWWALTAYAGVKHARSKASQIIPEVLLSERVQAALELHAARYHEGSTEDATRAAERILKSMVADLRIPALRFLGWVLSYVWARFYSSEVYVDWEGLQRVRALAKEHIL